MKKEISPFKVGQIVIHNNFPEWGPGKILNISDGKGKILFINKRLQKTKLITKMFTIVDMDSNSIDHLFRDVGILSANVGWAYALKDNSLSNWGNLDDFLDSINEDSRVVSEVSSFHNLIYPVGSIPRPGEGFAFYFTTRSSTTPGIYLVGILNDLRLSIDQKSIEFIDVSLDMAASDYLLANPLIRGENPELFLGMIDRGFVGGLYFIRPDKWKSICFKIYE